MYRKIIGILVTLLFFGTAVLPLISSADENLSDSCYWEIKYFGKSQLYEPLNLDDFSPKPLTMDTPDYFSWKDYNGEDWTTPAKDQSSCGSCWIFAATGILESVIKIREESSEINPDLSEQYVLSCLPEAGNGCNGGMPYDVFKYIEDTSPAGNNCNGTILTSCFPYYGKDDKPCEDKCPDWKKYLVPIDDHGYWITDESSQGIEDIKSQIMQGGPVVACMLYPINQSFWFWGFENHDPNDYFPYYEDEGVASLDHDIIVLGWKNDPLIPNGGYWICKNSFGKLFGYDGFFNMEYGLLGSLWIDQDPDTTYIVWVDYDRNSYYWDNEADSPGLTNITGPTSGSKGVVCEYFLNAEDPNEDDVRYRIDWGDGDSEITSYCTSGTDINVSHMWEKQGIYNITVQAEDFNNLLGPVSMLEVTIPRSRAISYPWFDWLLESFPLLERLLGLIR